MALDSFKNLAYSTVATAPDPANSGTALVVAAGTGGRFPTTPFNVTVWPADAIPTHSNAEIVRVTAVDTDTLTIEREQENSTARAIAVGDQIAASITALTLTTLEADIATASALATTADSHAGTASAAATSADGHAAAVSVLAGAASALATTANTHAATASAAATSADGHANTVSIALVAETAARASAINALSVTMVAADAALSVRIDEAGGGGGSVTSTELNTVSAAVELLSAKVVSVSAQIVSVEAHVVLASAAATSANAHAATASAAATSANARLDAVSCVSGVGLQAVVDALSADIAAIPGGGSATIQTAVLGTSAVISAASLTAVTGLSVPVSAGVSYQIEGFLMVNRGAAAQVYGYGLTFPAAKHSRGAVSACTSVTGAGLAALSVVGTRGIWTTAGSASVIASTISTARVSVYVEYNGVLVASAAGAVVPSVKASAGAGAATLLPGSYFKLLRLST